MTSHSDDTTVTPAPPGTDPSRISAIDGSLLPADGVLGFRSWSVGKKAVVGTVALAVAFAGFVGVVRAINGRGNDSYEAEQAAGSYRPATQEACVNRLGVGAFQVANAIRDGTEEDLGEYQSRQFTRRERQQFQVWGREAYGIDPRGVRAPAANLYPVAAARRDPAYAALLSDIEESCR